MLGGKPLAPGPEREGRWFPKSGSAGAVGKAALQGRACSGGHSHCQTCTVGKMLGEPTPALCLPSSILLLCLYHPNPMGSQRTES